MSDTGVQEGYSSQVKLEAKLEGSSNMSLFHFITMLVKGIKKLTIRSDQPSTKTSRLLSNKNEFKTKY
jgi:hypothetical protein